jgi:hypothetical protein
VNDNELRTELERMLREGSLVLKDCERNVEWATGIREA